MRTSLDELERLGGGNIRFSCSDPIMAAGDKGDSPSYPITGGVGRIGVFPPAATRCMCICCAVWYRRPGATPDTNAAAMEESDDDELD
jgi:hypothetical protein